MAVPTLLYGSECWTVRKRDTQKPQAAGMRFLRSVRHAQDWIKLGTKIYRKN
jgi:hypothetical protein